MNRIQNAFRLPLCPSHALAPLREASGTPGLMGRSIARLADRVAPWLARPIEVPGHGEAGSDAHNRHQLNSQLISDMGLLFQLGGDAAHAERAAQMLMRYADHYLELGFQPQRNTNPPGRIFHQILNENMWLVYASLGYGCVRHTLDDAQRRHIEERLFHPMVEMFMVKYAHDFDRIHNHGLWAVAATGLCGIVLGEPRYVDVAVDGIAGDREQGGFLAQISQLFAPSGYYIEGPYYHRFAIRPLLLFAEALHVHRPELDIYGYKNGVIGTTVRTLLASAYPDGRFPALNDASRSMGIRDEGVVIAAAIAHARYGDAGLRPRLAALARQQDEVWVHPAALALAAEADRLADAAPPLWPSMELDEGPLGDRGAQGILRARGQDGDISMAIMNYGQHGMGHGHFDTLGITLFNHGDEVLREYGFARWINVETKFGGRYLAENKSWARQTLAHNCVVVDEACQNGFSVERADSVHGTPHFFDASTPAAQVMSAFANDHHPGVGMQRSLLMLTLPGIDTPVLLDLFRLRSEDTHRYDYALQYSGQVTAVNLECEHARSWSPLGDANGYQHLLKVAHAAVTQGPRVTWLQGSRFNTWLSAADDGELVFAQLGGADPGFNLRREQSLLLRQSGSNHLFASAFETHGYFDEASEHCHGARGALQSLRVIGHDDDGSVVELHGHDFVLTVMLANRPGIGADTAHELQFAGRRFAWRGTFSLELRQAAHPR